MAGEPLLAHRKTVLERLAEADGIEVRSGDDAALMERVRLENEARMAGQRVAVGGGDDAGGAADAALLDELFGGEVGRARVGEEGVPWGRSRWAPEH